MGEGAVGIREEVAFM